MHKLYCFECSKIATWIYLPSDSDNLAYCENCVPRGCSCNLFPGINQSWITTPEEDWIQETDDQGRLLPCCEYLYNKEGFDEN